MRESIIEGWATSYANHLGVLSLKLNVRGNIGWPDRIYIYKGRVLFVEFKATGEKPRKIQEYIHQQLRSHDVSVVVCDSKQQAKEILDEFTSI
jgi:hypothetical protein